MARKSKQPGGHNPLTAYERKKYAKGSYGTKTARLGKSSQYTFASCGLSLHPARDRPVASPSGYIYERSSMLEYLLTKTQELKQQERDYEKYRSQQEASNEEEAEKKRKSEVERFESAQKVTTAKKQKTETNVLKRTSYWLADMQPNNDGDDTAISSRQKTPPPKRPPSPNTQKPLRRKDLIELELKRKSSSSSKTTKGGSKDDKDDPVLCAISEKEISTQQAIALVTVTKGSNSEKHPAHVVLEDVYRDLKIDQEKVPMCPVTGRKIRQVLKLQRGGSSFASADGRSVEAKLYRPTMT
jgi:nitric oxide synthase-interacting protein